jgi:hypothetical protein
VKIYDARVLGGFPYVPPEVPCKASDECHGPGSLAPAAPNIGSISGTPIGNQQNQAANRCRKHRRCGHSRGRHKHKHRFRHRRARHRRGGHG